MESANLYATRVAILGITVAPLIAAAYAASGRRLPAWLTIERRRLMLAALVVVGWVHLGWHMLVFGVNPGHDALAYWAVELDSLYDTSYGSDGLFVYSPSAAIVAEPLGLMPQPLFLLAWAVVSIAAVAWLARRETLIWMAFPPVIWLLVIGNIEILIGVAVVLGFRHSWTWSFVILTKVTPAVGILWFVVRREWRSLGIALGVTAVIVAVSYVVLPDAWASWLEFLIESHGSGGWLPLLPRVAVSAVLVVWGGLTDRRWTVLVAAILSVPHFWYATLGGLVALSALGFSWLAAISPPDTVSGRRSRSPDDGEGT